MAEEAEDEEEGGGGDGGGGSPLKKYGPLAAIVLIAQVVLAWVVIQVTLKDNPPEEEPEELFEQEMVGQSLEVENGEETLPFYFQSDDLKDIPANPAGTNAERFVVVSVILGLKATDTESGDDITAGLGENELVTAKLTGYTQRIRAIVVNIVRSKTIDQLESEFIDEVKDEIKRKLNADLLSRLFKIDENNKVKVVIEEVEFSSIIIQ